MSKSKQYPAFAAIEFDSVPAGLLVQMIREQGVKLESGDPPFGQQGAVLLDDGKKMGNGIVLREHNRFAEQGAALGAADIKHVAQTGQIRQ